MRIAILSDIHGNAWALKAVIAHAEKHGVTSIFDLGDSLYGPLAPQETFEIILQNRILSLSGNQDQYIVDHEKYKNKPTLQYVLDQLDDRAMHWLNNLPPKRVIHNNFFACHGSPAANDQYLVEEVVAGQIRIRNLRSLNQRLARISEPYILCGHSHIPRIIKAGNKTIINPGSVGLPAYQDSLPYPHKIENFNPDARYCILDTKPGITLEHVSIPYAYEKAAERATKNHRKDWAKWIRTGRV